MIGLLLLSNLAFGVTFSNGYVSFDLPDGWNCLQQDTEWVCRHKDDKTATESAIVFTAKEQGPTDSLEQYTKHLSTPQTNGAKASGKPSKIIEPPEKVVINDQPWIQSMHQDAEIKNYMTRYLATVHDGLAVAFSFTAHKDSFTKYNESFFRAAKTLRITLKKIARNSGTGAYGANGPVPMLDSGVAEPMATPVPPGKLGAGAISSKVKALMFVLAVITGATALVLLFKNKK